MKDNTPPRDIAWGLASELFKESHKEGASVFIPFATDNVFTHEIAQSSKAKCYQTFKSEVDALLKNGISCSQELKNESFDEVVFVPTKQKIESLGALAHSLMNLKASGLFIYCCHNQLGSGAFNSKIKEIFSDVEIKSAKKCRYLVLKFEKSLNEEQKKILNTWLEEAAPKNIAGSPFKSVPGIFGWNKIDKGSELLCSTLPPLGENGADLGSGYGYLSHYALTHSQNIKSLALVEAEHRALESAQENLKTWKEKCSYHWLDIRSDEVNTLGPFEWILMNPPFHDENIVDQELGRVFVEKASQLLKKNGILYMVAKEFLPYEKLLKELFSNVEVVLKQNGFKVLHAKR